MEERMYLIQKCDDDSYEVRFYDPDGGWVQIHHTKHEVDALRVASMYNRSLKGDY